MTGFNPCFNGTYSLTNDTDAGKDKAEESFNPCFNGTYSLTKYRRKYGI